MSKHDIAGPTIICIATERVRIKLNDIYKWT